MKKKPDDAVTHNNLGVAYTEKGLLDEAIDELRKSVKINPAMAMTHKNLEFAYRKKGMEKEAQNELKLYEELMKRGNQPQ